MVVVVVKRVCVLGTIFARLGTEVIRTPPSRREREGARMNWIGQTTFPFSGCELCFWFFFIRFSFLLCLLIFFSSSDAVILLVCQNALRKVRVSKKRTIDTVRSPVSHTIFFGISMKSQFYHSSRFTSPSSVLLFFLYFRICMVLFNFFFLVIFVPLSFRDIFFLAR